VRCCYRPEQFVSTLCEQLIQPPFRTISNDHHLLLVRIGPRLNDILVTFRGRRKTTIAITITSSIRWHRRRRRRRHQAVGAGSMKVPETVHPYVCPAGSSRIRNSFGRCQGLQDDQEGPNIDDVDTITTIHDSILRWWYWWWWCVGWSGVPGSSRHRFGTVVGSRVVVVVLVVVGRRCHRRFQQGFQPRFLFGDTAIRHERREMPFAVHRFRVRSSRRSSRLRGSLRIGSKPRKQHRYASLLLCIGTITIPTTTDSMLGVVSDGGGW